MRKKLHRRFLTAFVLVSIFTGIFFLAGELTKSTTVQEIVSEFGYVGVMIVAVIGGLNSFVPVPAATFTPLFVAAGLTLPLIVLTLALGTLVADFVGYALGHVSRSLVESKHPKLFSFFVDLSQNHRRFIIPVVFLYAAFIPFPNEILIIPLALSGVRFSMLLLPLAVGNIINQGLLSYGFTSAFDLLF